MGRNGGLSSGGKAGKGGKSTNKGQVDNLSTTKTMCLSNVKGATIRLRAALFNEDGTDRDVTEALMPPFMRFDRNGLDAGTFHA